MSLPRASTAAMNMFRFAAAPPPAARRCSQCLRPFSSMHIFRQSSRRQLQTATAYRPQTLDSDLPPPRNAGVPDTSIAGGVPKVDQPKEPQSQSAQGVDGQRAANPGSVGLSEGEAQKSQKENKAAASSTSTATPGPAPAKPRRSKLRPRKAAMTLSPLAVTHLRALLDQPEPKLIRVGVKNRGCSGLAYHLEYVDKAGTFDETVEQDGVKVLIDSKALFSIIGSEMDWIEDKLNERFIFKNPNITEQCGCGESFSIS
ncbi:hypothetical protein MBLNU459_g8054t1 [Dothideomycetes sp. NU459]